MFAALAVEREPLHYSDFGDGFFTWIMVAGAVAAVFLLLWLAFGWAQWRPRERAAVPRWQVGFVFVCCILSAFSYVLFSLFVAARTARGANPPPDTGQESLPLTTLFLISGGFFAVLAVGLPFVLNLFEQRLRRIFALAKLSFKEAIRSRILYAFSLILIVFLFSSWYISSKAEDQVRTYVTVFFKAMSVLLLGLRRPVLASFSLPADIKQQTIHTIVTKPVQPLRGGAGAIFRLPGADDAGAAGDDGAEPGFRHSRGQPGGGGREPQGARPPVWRAALREHRQRARRHQRRPGVELSQLHHRAHQAAVRSAPDGALGLHPGPRRARRSRQGALRVHLRRLPHHQGQGRSAGRLHLQVLHLAFQARQRRPVQKETRPARQPDRGNEERPGGGARVFRVEHVAGGRFPHPTVHLAGRPVPQRRRRGPRPRRRTEEPQRAQAAPLAHARNLRQRHSVRRHGQARPVHPAGRPESVGIAAVRHQLLQGSVRVVAAHGPDHRPGGGAELPT